MPRGEGAQVTDTPLKAQISRHYQKLGGEEARGAASATAKELVKVCKKAWAATPDVKILQAFEMRKDCAQEALEADGWCPNEGKGRGGSKRVHTDASYAWLRKKLKISDS